MHIRIISIKRIAIAAALVTSSPPFIHVKHPKIILKIFIIILYAKLS